MTIRWHGEAMVRAVKEAAAILTPLDNAIAEARATALASFGNGRPESLWTDYENEVGSLAEIEHASMRELLEMQLHWATLKGEMNLRIPRVIVLHMLDDLLARQNGRSARPPYRPKTSWRVRRYRKLAVEQVKARRKILVADGTTRADALEVALKEIAPRYYVSLETLRSWLENPRRLQARK